MSYYTLMFLVLTTNVSFGVHRVLNVCDHMYVQCIQKVFTASSISCHVTVLFHPKTLHTIPRSDKGENVGLKILQNVLKKTKTKYYMCIGFHSFHSQT